MLTAPPDVWPEVTLDEPSLSRRKKLDSVNLLTAYMALLFFIPSTLVFGPLGGAGTPAIVSSLVILIWYIASWISGRLVPSGGGRPMRIAMLAFSLSILASFVAAMTRSITQPEVLSADRGLIILMSWAGLVVVMSQTITTYDRLEVLLRRAVIGGTVVAAIGVFQYYSGFDITKVIQIPGLIPRVDITTLMVRNGLNRPASTATQPIEFGVVMALLLPFAIQQAFAARRPGEAARKFQRWAPVVLIGVAIPMSVSRSGVVGAVVALLLLIPTWSPQRRKIFLIALIPGIASLKVAAPGLVHTLITYFGGLGGNANPYIGLQTRTADYAYVFHYVAQYPWFGLGFGTFMPQLYIFTDNTYLLGLAETGAVGVLVLVALYLTSIFTAVAARKLTRDPGRRETGQALVASVAVGVAGSATFDALGFPMFSGLYFLILGAVGAYYGIMRAEAGLASGRIGYTEVKSVE